MKMTAVDLGVRCNLYPPRPCGIGAGRHLRVARYDNVEVPEVGSDTGMRLFDFVVFGNEYEIYPEGDFDLVTFEPLAEAA